MNAKSDQPATRSLYRDGALVGRTSRGFRLSFTDPQTSAKHEVVIEAGECRIGSRSELECVVVSPSVSRLHAELTITDAGYRLRDLGSTNGTFVRGLRIREAILDAPETITVGDVALAFAPLDREVDVPILASESLGRLVGASAAMRTLFAQIVRVAPTETTVLIGGETGTGKEGVARAIHERSARAAGPFVVIDCASLPAQLLESELFGHEKGAFTGASSARAGLLEEASGGTVFFDELGELPLELQPKLLRVLQEREVRRLGATRTTPLDVRVIAATHRDLLEDVAQGRFREDLYYRLAVIRLHTVPLRERREDIRLLVRRFLEESLGGAAAATFASIREANWQRLERHPWPGNVRELRNVVERTLALSANAPAALEPPTLPRATAATAAPPSVDLERPFVEQKAEILARFESTYLLAQLDRHGGNISRAAAAAGLDRMYFKRLLAKHRGDDDA